ncbi:MAG TPA: 16S rRNA (uracil(1498)-N(3))-methyltransferase [Casimicrobiaceae bacterium]|nr:16S rRNA (uracil(1498)-N(3))-methyltransferase [Casimicrobiaceae bacterium]
MLTPRLYVGEERQPPEAGDDYRLDDVLARHVGAALRMRVGDRIALFTGTGGEFSATIRSIDRRAVTVHVDSHDPVERESPWALTLGQSIIASDMMDIVVRKAVELGVASIVPLIAARSQHASDERTERRFAHWRRIVVAACEQCGRNRVPVVAPVATFAQWIADAHALHPIAILAAEGKRSLAAFAAKTPPRVIVAGPEGGFDAAELLLARDAGAESLHLGRRVLRAETAALTAIATVNAIAGDAC